MSSSADAQPAGPPLSRRRVMGKYVPMILAVLAIVAIYAIISQQLAPGPRGLLPGLIFGCTILLVVAVRAEWHRVSRTTGIVILGFVTLAEALSTSALILNVVSPALRGVNLPQATSLTLLRDAALLWLVNVLTFSLWYWELDDGGPGRRHTHGYHSRDFVFPQASLEDSHNVRWIPHYVDYLFLAFNTSTAFSPTDTQVLSVRAKLLMMMQSLISLVVLAIIAARAINTL